MQVKASATCKGRYVIESMRKAYIDESFILLVFGYVKDKAQETLEPR